VSLSDPPDISSHTLRYYFFFLVLPHPLSRRCPHHVLYSRVPRLSHTPPHLPDRRPSVYVLHALPLLPSAWHAQYIYDLYESSAEFRHVCSA